jgi:SET domain-containing protein
VEDTLVPAEKQARLSARDKQLKSAQTKLSELPSVHSLLPINLFKRIQRVKRSREAGLQSLVLNYSRLTAHRLLIASSESAIWKLARLVGLGNRFKVHNYANRDTRRGAEVKLSAPTTGVDDRTDDCAWGADDVAVPAKVEISTFSNDR